MTILYIHGSKSAVYSEVTVTITAAVRKESWVYSNIGSGMVTSNANSQKIPHPKRQQVMLLM